MAGLGSALRAAATSASSWFGGGGGAGKFASATLSEPGTSGNAATARAWDFDVALRTLGALGAADACCVSAGFSVTFNANFTPP
jgi:hypothetical protein